MAGSAHKGKSRAVPAEPISAAIPLGKQLAHTDKAVRDRAIASLAAFLSQGGTGGAGEGGPSTYAGLGALEMDKLWKGLFYCFWMSDKPLVQQRLAHDLAELLLQIDPAPSSPESSSGNHRLGASLAYLRGFWVAIVREWEGLDRLRMDKFYLLIRRFVRATFRLMARHDWSSAAVRGVEAILVAETGPLNYANAKIPISLSTHLADVYLAELDGCLSLPESPPAPLVELLRPFFPLLAHTPSSVVYKRLLEQLFLPLLDALHAAAPTEAEPPTKRKRTEEVYAHVVMKCSLAGGEAVSPAELRKGVLRAMFDAASKEGVRESNRRKIYQLWREEGGDDDDA